MLADQPLRLPSPQDPLVQLSRYDDILERLGAVPVAYISVAPDGAALVVAGAIGLTNDIRHDMTITDASGTHPVERMASKWLVAPGPVLVRGVVERESRRQVAFRATAVLSLEDAREHLRSEEAAAFFEAAT